MRPTAGTGHRRRLTASIAGIALAATMAGIAAAGPASAAAAGHPAGHPGGRIEVRTRHSQTHIVVLVTPNSLPAVTARVKQLNGKVTRVVPAANSFAAVVPVSAVAKLRADRRVLTIVPDTSR